MPALALLFVACSWYCVVRKRDAWPFSAFPMFERPVEASRLVVYRIALELEGGEVQWWTPHYYKLQQTLGVEFGHALSGSPEGLPVVQAVLATAAYWIRKDPGTASAQYLRVVRLRPHKAGGFSWSVNEDIVARYPLSDF